MPELAWGLPPALAIGVLQRYAVVRTNDDAPQAPSGGGRPISAKTYASVLHAMSWVGLAAAGKPAAEECLKPEFGVAHAHDALDGAFA